VEPAVRGSLFPCLLQGEEPRSSRKVCYLTLSPWANTNQSTDLPRSLLLSTKTEQTDPEVDSEIETLTTAVAGTHLSWSILWVLLSSHLLPQLYPLQLPHASLDDFFQTTIWITFTLTSSVLIYAGTQKTMNYAWGVEPEETLVEILISFEFLLYLELIMVSDTCLVLTVMVDIFSCLLNSPEFFFLGRILVIADRKTEI